MTVFKSGDLVVLKSGGPTMTVEAVNTSIFDDSKVTGIVCVWFVGDRLERVRFEHDAIEPVATEPVRAAQEVGSVAPDLVLQQGSVVNAQVLKILSADLVRIAISSLSIDVLSEVPLQAGQTLQLAVSQTPDGVRLAVVGQGADTSS